MKNFAPYLKLHTGKLIVCITFMFLFALVSTFSLSLLSPFLHAIFYDNPFSLNNDLLARFNEWFLHGSKVQAFVKLQIILVSVFLIKGIFGYLHQYLGVSIEENIMKKVRDDTYSHLHTLSLDYFHRTQSGVLVSRVTNDISMVKGAMKDGLLNFLKHLLLTVAYLGFALYLNWRLLLVSIITFPVLGWLLNKLAKKLREKSDKVQEDMAKITSTIGESIVGIKIVKAFTAEKFEINKFFKTTYNYLKSAIRFERVGLIGVPASELVITIGACILLSYGGYQIFVAHTLSADRFLIFLACALSMMQSLNQLPKANVYLQRGLQAMTRVRRILDIKPTVQEAVHPVSLKSFEKEITFREVHFSYDPSREVLCGVTLCIKKGENIALVGPSGAGKSTLTDLLARFYDPSYGSIEIDNINIKEVSLKDLRSLIGLVTQEPILFDDTAFNNIAYPSRYGRTGRDGIPNASPELVYRAAKLANANEFIEKLPKGYDSMVGERGVSLSGGERQRIAIARAFCKNPEILIFDEATSHLDPESESKVHSAMEKLLEGRTAIVIAHRLSTVRDRDRIIVIDHGKIVEEGTHSELLENEGLYNKLVKISLS